MNIEQHAALDQAQKRCAGANLDIVRMGTQAEDRQPFAGRCELQRLHDLALTLMERRVGRRATASPRVPPFPRAPADP